VIVDWIGPRTDELVDVPDEGCVWAWPDGYLHPGPPLPVAWVPINMVEELNAGRVPWPPWQATEQPPCDALRVVAAEETKDGQARAFACSLAAGHDGRHVCITDLADGHSTTWPTLGVEGDA
jgi:hypothetical protein